MATVTATKVSEDPMVLGRLSEFYEATMTTGDTFTPIMINSRAFQLTAQLVPVVSGTGKVQWSSKLSTPAATDWIDWVPGSVSAATGVIIPTAKWINLVCTVGTVKLNIWSQGGI